MLLFLILTILIITTIISTSNISSSRRCAPGHYPRGPGRDGHRRPRGPHESLQVHREAARGHAAGVWDDCCYYYVLV